MMSAEDDYLRRQFGPEPFADVEDFRRRLDRAFWAGARRHFDLALLVGSRPCARRDRAEQLYNQLDAEGLNQDEICDRLTTMLDVDALDAEEQP